MWRALCCEGCWDADRHVRGAQVQVSKAVVPDYGTWVRPEEEMWLGRIAKKLGRHEYGHRSEFLADFRQLLRNARAYNLPGRGTWGMPGARPAPGGLPPTAAAACCLQRLCCCTSLLFLAMGKHRTLRTVVDVYLNRRR